MRQVSLVAGLAAVLFVLSAHAAAVHKVAETFDDTAWPADTSSTATARSSLSDDVPDGVKSAASMQLEAQFSGQGFQWCGVSTRLTLPGDAKAVSLRSKRSDKRYSFFMKLTDGWGRTTVGKQKLEWGVPAEANGEWQAATFTVPRDWVRPITITGFGVHNWFARNVKSTVRFWVDHLEVVTDVSAVDPATGLLEGWRPNPEEEDPQKKQPPRTPLLVFRLSTPEVSNVFSRKPPAAEVLIRNWRAATLRGEVAWCVLDDAGKAVCAKKEPVAVDSTVGLRLWPEVARFGLYRLEARLKLAGEKERVEGLVFARVPPYADLTEAQKTASPYGMNVHGGSTRMVVLPFRKAGIIWFRDYAFQFPTLTRAKGGDRRYAGWPWYPPLIQRYFDAGVRLLPCSQKAIQAPKVADGKVVGRIGPDRAWIREIADFINAFPQVTHWELGNEYELNKENARAEELCGWRNYQAYHRTFGEVLTLLGAGEVTAVEQGRAGIWPARIRQCVESGAFDPIAVVNSHHYCGVEPPETNFGNFNTGFDGTDGQQPMLFSDALREVKRAARADGKPRQSWLTELGWDTLAGKVVSPEEQAAYLARGYMLAIASGTDKTFWFFDYDSPTPKQFFDGCGLLAANGEPKLALCAMAGLSARLPSPRYVGSLEAGPNTAGYVFENDGTLVAALWAIEGDAGPSVSIPAEQLYDYLGNKLPGQQARLRRAPVYAAGLDKASRWYRQTAYSIHTPSLVVATAGDTVRPILRVANNRGEAIQCKARLDLPKGWSADAPEITASVEKGKTSNVPLAFRIPGDEPLGRRDARIVISEGDALKTLPLTILVRTPLIMEVGALRGRPGDTTVKIKVGNMSARALDATLTFRLPASWKAAKPQVAVAALKPGEVREIECHLTWSADWQVGESATAELDAGAGRRVARPIIPNHHRLQRAKGLKVDGDLADWPKAAEVPAWMLGTTLAPARAKAYLAWAPEGIYAAVAVTDTKVQASDPRSFWAGDCLELFLDTGDDKRHRLFEPGDHQFWFVPLVKDRRIYAGQWKRKDEIPATRYDIQAVRGAARRTEGGYVMEFLLPAAELHKFQPKAGARLGVNLNLTVKGTKLDREIYWPARKDWGVMNLPKTWGTMVLVE